jgi:hypothetical protein
MSKLRIITVEINLDKIKHDRIVTYRTQKIIEENWVQFSKVLYADFENIDKQVFTLVRDIIQKFHLYQ